MSIRRQLKKDLLASLFLLFGVFCFALFLLFKQLLLKEFDNALLLKAQTFASLVEYEYKGEHLGRKRIEFEIEFHEKNIPEFQKGKNPEYYKLSTFRGGKLLAESESFEGHTLNETVKFGPEDIKPYHVHYGINDVKLPSGKNGRAITYVFYPKPEGEDESHGENESTRSRAKEPQKKIQESEAPVPELSLVLALSREAIDQSALSLLSAMAVLGFLLPLAVILFINQTLSKSLAPLDQIARETESINPENLAHRFDSTQLPDELQPIALRLNELLERVQTALQREQRFNSDVAHELRTPIAELRTLSEVGLKNVGKENPQTYFEDSLDIALRMEHLTTALLELKRI